MIATIVSGCSGGTSLSDVEELGSDKPLLKLLGLKKILDQTARGEWLRALDQSGRDALKKLNRRLCTWILHQCSKEKYCYGVNDARSTLGAIAYNLLGAMKLLVLPGKDLAKRPRTIMQRLLLLPMELKSHARQLKAVISVCAERFKVWEAIFAEWLPDHRLNRRSG